MRIKERLRELRLSQAELARRTGLNVTVLNLICNDRLKPNEKQRQLIAEALGVNPSDLWPSTEEATHG